MRKTLHMVVALVTLLWAWGVSWVLAQSETGRPFITKWQGEAGKELKIPIVGRYKMVIKDGSGNEKVNATVTVDDAAYPYLFTPTEDGTYTVEAGSEGVRSMQMKVKWKDNKWIPLTSNDKLLEVVQFGTVKWESMEEMFQQCKNMTFAAGIDTPDLSRVTNMAVMFAGCSVFNHPIGNWNVSKVTKMKGLFNNCSAFNQSLNNWDVSNVTDMSYMFSGCASFNQPLEKWDVRNVTRMGYMFDDCSAFNQPLNKWDVSKVKDMGYMFLGCSTFNQPLDNWNVSNVTSMGGMFWDCPTFNQPLGKWNVSNVTSMGGMFWDCPTFNQPLGKWNVSNVGGMELMFKNCSSFNHPLDKWNVSNVTEMEWMFSGCSSFNQPLNNWDVSNVEDMREMFSGCSSFNQPLCNWNVSNVKYMERMFAFCSSFNQPLGSWKIKTAVGGLSRTAMSPSNYSQTLVGWAEQTDIAGSLNFEDNVENLIYNDEGKAARQKLIDKGWKFDGDIYQSSGVAITPCFLPLVLNREFTLLLEKWGVAETEEVTLSTDTEGVISYEWTADRKGVHIKGLKEGKCELTATIAAKAGVHEAYTCTCEISVYIPIERFTITPVNKTLKVGEEFTFTVNFFPENATKRGVEWKWECYKTEIATVDDNGKVTAKKAGKCTVYVDINEYGREVEEECKVTVVDEIAAVASITIPEKQTLTVGTIIPLIGIVKPDNAEQGLVWSSSDPEIATVSEGVVWGKKTGECTITVKSLDKNCTIIKECKITVGKPRNGGKQRGRK